MLEFEDVKIFAKTVEPEAISQIYKMKYSPIGKDAHIRIMPDCHAGAGCVIGTTMLVGDKVCPNLVGVDIGCGVLLVKTDIDFGSNLDKLDKFIRDYIPYGMEVHNTYKLWFFDKLRCWKHLAPDVIAKAYKSLGTLGGGNHFIEVYNNGYIAVHSGSRNIGYKVAEYYQNLAIQRLKEAKHKILTEDLMEVVPKEREQWLKEHKDSYSFDSELAYLTGQDMKDYLHDVGIMQQFANDNREEILRKIITYFGGKVLDIIHSVHNYIDLDHHILRKGAISAQYGEKLVIPLNMRDGVVICRGKGNSDWNYSAPHGAGRLYSRSKAKELFTVEEYQEAMKGIYSTCISQATLDEAPFVYKDFMEILECIEPTVELLKRLIPIYNFKAN